MLKKQKKKKKASHHLILKADETVMASYCIYSPRVTRCTWLQITGFCKMSSLFCLTSHFEYKCQTAVTKGHFIFRKTVACTCIVWKPFTSRCCSKNEWKWWWNELKRDIENSPLSDMTVLLGQHIFVQHRISGPICMRNLRSA